MKGPTFRSNQSASVLLVAVLVIAILALALASTIIIASNKYHGAFQAASWQEALRAAESGADLAMAALANPTPSPSPSPSTGLRWYTASGSPPRALPNPTPTPSAASTLPAPGSYNYTTTPILYHGGEGNTRLSMFVTIDVPSPNTLSGPGGQWYRIRSTGTADVPGRVEASLRAIGDAHDRILRKLMLVFDRNTGLTVTKPQVSRVVEVLARVNTFQRAITMRNQIVMEQDNLTFVDSYDSTDPAKSTSGLYDSSKRQSHGDIATNNSSGSNLKSDYIYGNLNYNGPSIPNSENVQGTKTPSFTDTMPTVSDPGNGWAATDTSVTNITSGKVLTGGTVSAPARYKVSSINLTSGNATINPNVSGQQSYIEIWVTGDVLMNGGGIAQTPGVHATYYIDGNITLDNGTFDNQDKIPANLQIYGVTPLFGQKTLIIENNPTTIIGNIDAPDFKFDFASNSTFTGSLIGYSANVHATTSFHYDESSAGKGRYAVASWYEDSR